MGEELKSLSLLNLRDLAKAKGVKNISKLNKDDLIKAILEASGIIDKKEENIDSVKMETDSIDEIIQIENKTELEEPKLNNKEDLVVEGVLEVLPDGFGFLRGENYLSNYWSCSTAPMYFAMSRPSILVGYLLSMVL